MWKRLALPLVIIATIMIGLEVIESIFGLTSEPSLGYDKLLHFLGGSWWAIVGVGLAASGMLGIFNTGDPLCDREIRNVQMWVLVIVGSIGIGILWEVGQVYLPWLRDASDYNWRDTIGDVIFDALGGIVVGLVYQEKG